MKSNLRCITLAASFKVMIHDSLPRLLLWRWHLARATSGAQAPATQTLVCQPLRQRGARPVVSQPAANALGRNLRPEPRIPPAFKTTKNLKN